MILHYLSQFDIKAEPNKKIQNKPLLNMNEHIKADEQREIVLPEYAPNPISNNEDGDHVDPNEETQAQLDASDHEESLPMAELSQTRPQRATKRRRDDDLYEYGT